jgi:hypothetical protein
MLHLEESGNKEQRKAGGFNYDILDELWVWKGPSRQATPQLLSSRPLTTHDMVSGFARLRSQSEVSADYPRGMDWRRGVGGGWLLFDTFGGLAAGWRR